MGQTLSQKGLWVDGCVVLQGDTAALGTEVVSGDNAHGDNQQALEEEALDTAGWAQPPRQFTGHAAVCSKENPSPMVTPISADQACKTYTQAGLDAGVLARLQGVHLGGGEVTACKHCIMLVPGRHHEAAGCSMPTCLPRSGLTGHS